MNKALLTIAIASLVLILWAAWSHFQGALTQDSLFTHAIVLSVVWFVTATYWNARRG